MMEALRRATLTSSPDSRKLYRLLEQEGELSSREIAQILRDEGEDPSEEAIYRKLKKLSDKGLLSISEES